MHSSVTPDAHAEGPADGEPSSRAREVSSMRAHSPEEALQHIFADGSRTSAALGFGYRRLWGTLADATDGGKRVRPALFTAAYRSWGGTDTGAAAVVGAAIELLHTAFVVHDDVIDGDDTRHGRLNVSGAHIEQARAGGVEAVRAREYGAAAGILAGDLALAAALKAVATCPAPRPIVHELLELFDRALHVTAAGELADVRMSLFPEQPTLDETLTVEERKTGVYSFGLPLQAGAVLAQAPAEALQPAGDVGRSLGIAFQLVDDILGVFGDPATTGKSAVNDLRSGKQTPLIAHARTTASWPDIAPYVGRPDLSETQVADVREMLVDCGSRRFVEDLATDYAADALALGAQAGMPPALVTWMTAMTSDLLGRAAA
jgi:geranylgeranyl diphosphate synthase type II